MQSHCLNTIRRWFPTGRTAAVWLIAISGFLIFTWNGPSVVHAQAVPPTPTVIPAAGPSTGQVNQGDLLLLQAQLQNQAQQLQEAQQDALDSKNSAGAAVMLSLVAMLFGIVGLVVAALAILRSRVSGPVPGSGTKNGQSGGGSAVEGG